MTRSLGNAIAISGLLFVPPLPLAACANTHAQEVSPLPEITSIYWSDGDSGRINGDMKFRLANVDAPETGGIGAWGGAECERERILGFEAKDYLVKLSRKAKLSITKIYGPDRYNRLVLDLNAENVDVGAAGIEMGYLKAWPHMNSQALTEKPEWCVR